MRRHRLTPALLAALLTACGDGPQVPTGDPSDLSGPWHTAAPAEVGFDVARLDAAIGHAATLPQIFSLLVVRNGHLVVERYFNGNRADSLNDVRSVTKSVLSTLAGIAVDRAELDLEDAIGPHLEPWAADLDATESATRVRDLLTMAGGWTWDESTVAGYNDWVLSDDPVTYLLRRPLEGEPGTAFRYNTAGVHLLGVVVEHATGRPLQAYAQEHLFEPLGIERVRWEEFPGGRANGGSGLDLRPRDLAKLGQLWLRGGDAGSTRILHPGWLEEGTKPAYPYWPAAAPLGQQSYGWLWWLAAGPGPAAFHAQGFGGQFIWVVPSLDLVVVVTHDWRTSPVPASQLTRNGMALIVERVVPAAR